MVRELHDLYSHVLSYHHLLGLCGFWRELADVRPRARGGPKEQEAQKIPYLE